MKDDRKYLFVGNREFVLRKMLEMGLNVVKALVMEGSYLERALIKEPLVEYEIIHDKTSLIKRINEIDFNVLISNGCIYILPISKLKETVINKDVLFINIHPSWLPDLRGMDPLNGACLLDKDSGATCHYMDDGIDTGKIISQERIPMTDDIDTVLLFQLSFIAERNVFVKAYERGFKEQNKVTIIDNPVYYSIKQKDMFINFEKGFDYILHQVRAFGYRSKGLHFAVDNNVLKAFSAGEVTNQYVQDYFKNIPECIIGLSFEDNIIFKFENRLLRLGKIKNDNNIILLGKSIETPDE